MIRVLFYITITLGVFKSMMAQPWPPFTVTVCQNEPSGYYFLQALKVKATGPVVHPTQMILDGKGRVVYFKTFAPGEWSGDFQLQPNGLMSYNNDAKKRAYLMDKNFKIVDSVSPKNGLSWDFHEFRVLKNGHFVFMATELKTMDLSAYHLFNKKNEPGSDTAKVLTWLVQELDENKKEVFRWNSTPHYDIRDMDYFYLGKATDVVDIVHINSIDYRDDYFIISARGFNEVTKVNKKDGSIVWRLGGKKNQFKFLNDTAQFFGQHCPRLNDKGNLILFDNGQVGPPFHASTAKEYRIDEKNKTVELVWSFTDNIHSYSPGYGNIQELPGNHVLVDYGRNYITAPMFNVVHRSGKKVFEICFKDSLKSYRTYFYPELPWKLNRPVVEISKQNDKTVLTAPEGHKEYFWCDGQTGREIVVTKAGDYYVMVPVGNGGYIASEPIEVKEKSIQKK